MVFPPCWKVGAHFFRAVANVFALSLTLFMIARLIF